MSSRRTFLQGSMMAAGGLLLRASRAQAKTSPTAVHTTSGTLSGELAGEVRVFRGVPFARPPVGPLRFRPPEPPAAWTGAREATRFAAAAPQAPGNFAQDEDCLYLNVWAPRAPGSYPVFVWIHGGGFTGGRSFDPLFDGTGFAERGVVVVTVAYRLGVLGFLDLEPALGSAYAGSANNGLRDLLMALGWVQREIAAFGGDPRRVTVGGESAGAKLTDVLMGTPAAKPLFAQAISESGGAERIATRAAALEVSRGFEAAWTAQTGGAGRSLLPASTAQLVEVKEKFVRTWPSHFPLRPEIDGDLLARPPLEAIQAGLSRDKRLLLGTNRDESALFIGPDPQEEPGARELGNMTVAQFRPIEDEYAAVYPQMTAPLRRIRSLTAEEYLVPSIRVVDAHVAAGGAAYVYRLDFPGSGRFAGLAFHSYDLRFVWNHLGEDHASGAHMLADGMHAAWASFLRGETPAGPALPTWPLYTRAEKLTMILDVPSHVEAHPEQAELDLWRGWMAK